MKTYRIKRGRKNGTRTKRTSNSSKIIYSPQNIVTMFLQMLNTVKLYHWKTSSYAQHKATDSLYSDLNDSIDTFVEIMLGKNGGSRLDLTGRNTLPLMAYTDVIDFKKEVERYKDFLIGMSNDTTLCADSNSDLMNTRDEILGQLNQFTYLLTFK
jgi:DNA-binding ferritin-like protein